MNDFCLGPLSLSIPRVVGTVTSLAYLRDLPADLSGDCDIVEARLDQFEPCPPTQWLQACLRVEAEGTPVLATIRLPQDGGKWQRQEHERKDLLVEAFTHLSAIDVETDSLLRKDLCDLALSLRKSLVVSYHNFEGTPPLEELCDLVDSILDCPLAIPKLAIMVHNKKDVGVLRQVLASYPASRPICVLGMGDAGVNTRLSFPGLGSKLTYGYMNQSCAPGQLPSKHLLAALRQP
jgi:3-dehydroquinate dehydratase-1